MLTLQSILKLFDSLEKELPDEELVDNLVENFVHICLKHLGAKKFTSCQKFLKIYEGREKLSLGRKYICCTLLLVELTSSNLGNW